ncbi:MAG: hypothetical protein AB7H97_06395 [Pseudobdellovibrionaceae bacterium]
MKAHLYDFESPPGKYQDAPKKTLCGLGSSDQWCKSSFDGMGGVQCCKNCMREDNKSKENERQEKGFEGSNQGSPKSDKSDQ